MAVRSKSPRDTSLGFAAAINSGDLESALEHWMPGAVLVSPDGEEARGADEIRRCLAALIGSGAKLEIELDAVIEGPEIALGGTTMAMTLPHASGQRIEFRGTVVYTRAPDGWRFAIDAPVAL
jgi:ketosteroid isomerase-like protein